VTHQNMSNSVRVIKPGIIALALGIWIGYLLWDDSARVLMLESQLRMARQAVRSSATQRHSPWSLRPPSIQSVNPATPEAQREFTASEYKNQRSKEISEEWIARHASEVSVEYSKVLDELGLRPEQIEHVKAQLMMIHRMAVEAGGPLRDLGDFRLKYDQELRSALGEANYSRYLEYEQLKPARKELDLINAHASKATIDQIEGSLSEQIIRLIKDSKAVSTEEWHGPYDPAPRPLVGKEKVTDSLNQQISDLTIRANRLLEAARSAGIPDGPLSLLQSYYETRISGLQERVMFVNRSQEQRTRDLLQRLPASVREKAQIVP
jgi:hypothetical protein